MTTGLHNRIRNIDVDKKSQHRRLTGETDDTVILYNIYIYIHQSLFDIGDLGRRGELGRVLVGRFVYLHCSLG